MTTELEEDGKTGDVYENSFLPFIKRWGRIINLVAVAVAFGPVIVIAAVFGIVPSIDSIAAGAIAAVSLFGIFWFIEPIAYYPVLGIPGTYMAFLSGNISNLRLPCSVVAQEATGVEMGTKEGSIISTLGISSSIFVNITILTIGVLVGTEAIQALPAGIRTALQNYLVPALFGGIFVQFLIDYIKLGMIAIAIGAPLTIALKMGYLDMFPGVPSYVVIIVSIFGTVLIGRFLYSRDMIKVSEAGINSNKSPEHD